MSHLGDELRDLAVRVAVDVHAGGYTQQTGARLRREILGAADLADDEFNSEAVLAFVREAHELVKANPGREVTITLIDHEPTPPSTMAPLPFAVSLEGRPSRPRRQQVIETRDDSAGTRKRRRERAANSRVRISIGSGPVITSDVAFGPHELGLLQQGLRGQHGDD